MGIGDGEYVMINLILPLLYITWSPVGSIGISIVISKVQ